MTSAGHAFAGYPIDLVPMDIEGRAVTMLVVRRLEDYVDAEGLLRDAGAPEPPYWLHLWVGARALASEVIRSGGWPGRRVLEVGCGLGLPGVVAASLGAQVVLMDVVHDALRFARENARRNGAAVAAVQADGRQSCLRGRFDTILLADATYDPVLQSALAALIAAHLAPGGRALVAESVRTHDDGFRRECEARGLALEERHVRLTDDGRAVAVRLSEVSWR
jgi:predicted nicotinamide N-methyase